MSPRAVFSAFLLLVSFGCFSFHGSEEDNDVGVRGEANTRPIDGGCCRYNHFTVSGDDIEAELQINGCIEWSPTCLLNGEETQCGTDQGQFAVSLNDAVSVDEGLDALHLQFSTDLCAGDDGSLVTRDGDRPVRLQPL